MKVGSGEISAKQERRVELFVLAVQYAVSVLPTLLERTPCRPRGFVQLSHLHLFHHPRVRPSAVPGLRQGASDSRVQVQVHRSVVAPSGSTKMIYPEDIKTPTTTVVVIVVEYAKKQRLQ